MERLLIEQITRHNTKQEKEFHGKVELDQKALSWNKWHKKTTFKQVLEYYKDKTSLLEGEHSLYFYNFYFVFPLQSYFIEYIYLVVYIRPDKCG